MSNCLLLSQSLVGKRLDTQFKHKDHSEGRLTYSFRNNLLPQLRYFDKLLDSIGGTYQKNLQNFLLQKNQLQLLSQKFQQLKPTEMKRLQLLKEYIFFFENYQEAEISLKIKKEISSYLTFLEQFFGPYVNESSHFDQIAKYKYIKSKKQTTQHQSQKPNTITKNIEEMQVASKKIYQYYSRTYKYRYNKKLFSRKELEFYKLKNLCTYLNSKRKERGQSQKQANFFNIVPQEVSKRRHTQDDASRINKTMNYEASHRMQITRERSLTQYKVNNLNDKQSIEKFENIENIFLQSKFIHKEYTKIEQNMRNELEKYNSKQISFEYTQDNETKQNLMKLCSKISKNMSFKKPIQKRKNFVSQIDKEFPI